MRTLDDSDIDEVIEQPAQSQKPKGGMRTLGDDEIEDIQDPSDFEAQAKAVIDEDIMPVAETALDFSKGFAQGSTFGAADEVGGGLAAILEKGLSYIPGTAANNTKNVDEQLKSQGFQVPEESFADSYAGYQQASEDSFDAANERSPVMNTVGNIGGSIASGIVTGNALGVFGGAATKAKPILDIAKNEGKLKAGLELLKRGGTAYAKASPLMLAEGIVGSDDQLVGKDANPMEVVKDAASNMAFGVPAILGMQGISDVVAPGAKNVANKAMKAADGFIDESPFLRKAKKAFEFGEQGINPTSEKNKEMLLGKQNDKTQSLLKDIKSADKKLGQEVGKSLEVAEKAGQVINIDEPVNKALNALQYSYENLQDMNTVSRGKQIFSRISNKMGSDVTPLEAKDLLDDVDAFIGKFKASNNRTTPENQVLETLLETRKQLSESMKSQIDGYRNAAKRFEDFRSLVPETILAGEKPADVKNVFMGNLRNSDEKLFDKLNTLNIESSGQGSGVENVIKAKKNTIDGMRQFELNEKSRNDALLAAGEQANLNPMKMSSAQFGKTIQENSDEAQMLRDMQTVKSPSVTGGNIVQQTFQMGKGSALTGANAAGRIKKPLVDLSKRVYNMPAEKLSQYATTLQNVPGLKMYGKALQDGLANGDQAKKNAALFSIMQNPNARLYFDNNEDEEN